MADLSKKNGQMFKDFLKSTRIKCQSTSINSLIDINTFIGHRDFENRMDQVHPYSPCSTRAVGVELLC